MKEQEIQRIKAHRAGQLTKQPYSLGPRSIQPRHIETPEEARATGREMAEQVVKKLKLHLDA